MQNSDRNTTILVTGAGGGLGTALLAELDRSGYKNVLSPTRSAMDLLDKESVSSYIKKHKPKKIMHLASLVYGLGGNLKFQLESALANTAINNNLFWAIAESSIEDVFFAGTVASYPFPYDAMPIKEDVFFNGLPHRGEFGYAMAKRHAYTYLSLLAEQSCLRFTYGIFTNLYGPQDKFDINHGHVIPSLIANAYAAKKNKKPLQVWGDGNAIRDFLYFSDAARAAILCLNNPINGVINISSAEGIKISKIAELIGDHYGIDQMEYLTDRPVGIPVRVVDNTYLKKLGFSASTRIENGIRQTCEWYENNFHQARHK